jgi:hypothetical protein
MTVSPEWAAYLLKAPHGKLDSLLIEKMEKCVTPDMFFSAVRALVSCYTSGYDNVEALERLLSFCPYQAMEEIMCCCLDASTWIIWSNLGLVERKMFLGHTIWNSGSILPSLSTVKGPMYGIANEPFNMQSNIAPPKLVARLGVDTKSVTRIGTTTVPPVQKEGAPDPHREGLLDKMVAEARAIEAPPAPVEPQPSASKTEEVKKKK